MDLVDKIASLIFQVKNEADTDKRKLIDEVAGIMKDGGCDDELIRTAIGKMEKIAYDDSEAGTADNKKAKNADEEEEEEKFEEEKEVANKKAKNEDKDEEDKKEDESENEDEEEDKKDEEEAENKCKNSMDDIRKAIYGGKSEIVNNGYLTKDQRLELGNNY